MTDSHHRSPADVRMRGFAHRAMVDQALAWLDEQLDRAVSQIAQEAVPLVEAAGRVLIRSVVAEIEVPAFARAMMDGYAVRAADTAGATPYSPLPLRIVGQSLPGLPFAGQVIAGQAVRIMTGAPLPTGSDAVLPAEKAECDGESLLAQGEVSPGKHVGRRGEDVASGDTVLSAGRLLRPQDVGVLSSLGCAEVPLVRRPRVKIVVTGNELVPAGSKPQGCRVADANGPMLAALVWRDGGTPIQPGIVPDDPAAISAAMRSEADVVLVSGGSSVGQEDYAPAILADEGELVIHGIAMRPSSPAGMGRLGGALVFLLPGNPVSCLCAYDFFAGRAIRALAGLPREWPYRSQRLPLARKITSALGRVDYVRVQVVDGAIQPLATSGASILTSTTRADGFVVVPENSEGHGAGEAVDIYLY